VREVAMEPSIPVPTDNIYKFIGLFGLVVFISSMLAVVYLTSKNNEVVFKGIEELRNLQMKEKLTLEESNRKYVLEGILQNNTTSTIIYLIILASFLLFGFILSIFGIYYWFKKVQPKQDELLNLQIEKMRREIQVLDKQLEKKDTE
jgi:hypothetical protein